MSDLTLFWTKTWDALASAIFPTPCVSCGELIAAHDPPLCAACWLSLPLIEGPLCGCGAPLAGDTDAQCGRCRRGRSVVARGASLGFYDGPLRECVVALKYRDRHKAARGLALRLLKSDACRGVLVGATALVPVPLHPRRLRLRGFNQAELLCDSLAEEANLRVKRELRRVRDTPSQTDLSAAERRLNVRGAFIASVDSFVNEVVVLVDDVTTTGATLRECARTLIQNGALEVRTITVARAE